MKAGVSRLFLAARPANLYRYNYCNNTFVDSGDSVWAQAATGGGDGWVILQNPGATNGAAFYFTFANEFCCFSPVNDLLSQIAVGVNDVWGINSSNQIFRYDPNPAEFVQVAGQLVHIAAGGDGGWGINQLDQIFRFDSSSESWVQVDALSRVSWLDPEPAFGESILQVWSSPSFGHSRCESLKPGRGLCPAPDRR
jgi:hypothetical protein